MKLVVYTDGGAKVKTKESVCGFVIKNETGENIFSGYKNLGEGTVNTAEYSGAILGLWKARSLGATHVELIMDSQLVVRQIQGEYAIRQAHLKPYLKRVREIINLFYLFEIRHVKREFNTEADLMANLAYKPKRYML